MGNTESSLEMETSKEISHSVSEEITNNGNLFLDQFFLPEELLIILLSHIPPKDLLKCKLVCKEWNRLIKLSRLWREIYKRFYGKTPKHLPWYLFYIKLTTDFFDTNLIKNSNGESQFQHWKILNDSMSDGFKVEDIPEGSQPLPPSEDFNGHSSCFATSFQCCAKQQIVKFDRPIFKEILNRFKPVILASEWYAPRFDCASQYKLTVRVVGSKKKFKTFETSKRMEQWTVGEWKKVELLITDYDDVQFIVFQHEGQDSQFWQGHYGSKMAGGSLKILFDTIELPVAEKVLVAKKRCK